MISIFELFSIGIGPSSSHTVGPMRAANSFLQQLSPAAWQTLTKIEVTLYGSLALTGRGHGTDRAIILGLMGEAPETIDPATIANKVTDVHHTQTINLLNKKLISWQDDDITFNVNSVLDFHSNAMTFVAYDDQQQRLAKTTFYSIGGGFILNEKDIHSPKATDNTEQVPYPFHSANELLHYCQQHQLTVAQVMMANEKTWKSETAIRRDLLHIAQVMFECIEQGCHQHGELAGGLKVKRRAADLYQKLLVEGKPEPNNKHIMNWLNAFALAVNEENAAGHRVVTAPTNGAAGIIPAVLNYYRLFFTDSNEDGIIDFLLTAGAIGILYKENASISGAEMGCQGEVGVACSMAAGALAAVLGGTPSQVDNAAEIGMEHNLGLTCDPVAGLVQIPCIERNAMGAVKAVNAAQLALAASGRGKVTLDMVIQSMREIGEHMNSIYKETSRGGLAIAVNLSEC